MTFDQWFTSLKDHIWFWERIQKRHPEKDLDSIAKTIFETMNDESLSEQRFAMDRIAQRRL